MTVDLSQEIIPGTGLEDWFKHFGTQQYPDYGLEFLTAAHHETIDIDREKYRLPIGVRPAFLEERVHYLVMGDGTIPDEKKMNIIKNRLRTQKLWSRGVKPRSILVLDTLREPAREDYYIDLLRPVAYNGRILDINGIPYSHHFSASLAYLHATIIAGGYITKKKDSQIRFSHAIEKDALVDKLRGAITNPDYKESDEKLILMNGYLHILEMIGVGSGRLVNETPDKLGMIYLNKLAEWAEQGSLSRGDYKHAVRIISRFVEGIIDHRTTINKKGEMLIKLPWFNRRETSELLAAFFMRGLGFIEAEFDLVMYQPNKEEKRRGKFYYHSDFHVPKKRQREIAHFFRH